MLFTSISFLYYFLPLVLIIYFIVPRKYKNLILFIFSLLFYFYGEPKYIFLMLLEIFVAYIGAILVDKYKSKDIFIFIIFIHILLLVIFKYTDFIIEIFNNVFNFNLKLFNISLPIGISFYTFQIISYIVDVYKGKVKVQKNFLKLATYISLFPQLIAGPIVRYESIEKELDDRKETFEDFSYGVRRFVIGLLKKVLIANILGELITKFNLIDERSVLLYWIFSISYMLQVYFDFSAYSDMAIGLGRMFGFNFFENFNYPLISSSITEFWRRWHISLSSFFRDYVYIPLGGNRVSKIKWIRNIFIVWFLTGFWHGAAWNFIIWGLFFACFLLIEKLFLKDFLDKHKIIGHIYTLFLVIISFVIFNADSFNYIINFLKNLFGFGNIPFINKETMYYFRSYGVILFISFVAATPLFKNLIIKFRKNKNLNTIIDILEVLYYLLLLLLVTSYLIDASFNPFLYFRF